MIIVDTNVIAYLYFPGHFTAASEALLEQDQDWAAPVLWRSEFRNVLGGYMRRGLMSAEQAMRVANQIEAGMVFVNGVGLDGVELPFGGIKRSGFGRELGRFGIDEFVNKKLIRVVD